MGIPINFQLSDEQQLFIEKALQGENILVDACIGSGKTTAIQNLCNELPSKKKVLYFIYNRLLKLDAQSKIKKKNVTVTNYHGFAAKILRERGISVGVSDLIQKIIQIKPLVKKYDILCLGARTGMLSDTLNILEERYPNKFNKNTVYATISDNDSMGKTVPREDSSIFTTYDSSKGLERKICVVFDFTESYWSARISKPQQPYIILRNIFCVAASRGKNQKEMSWISLQ